MSRHSLLSLEGVNTFYGPVQVHFDLSLDVGRGQIVCLLGGNASGKSTTMKIILGLVKPRVGRVHFDGAADHRPADAADRAPRRRLGARGAPPVRRHERAREPADGRLSRATTAPAIAEDLDRVLTLFPSSRERLSQRAGTLSGGEQQMVAMARALMGRPRLICMDEPTMGLSPLWVDRVLELIAAINNRRASPSSWSSRTRAWRSRSPITATCCRPAASCSTARPRELLRRPAHPRRLSRRRGSGIGLIGPRASCALRNNHERAGSARSNE